MDSFETLMEKKQYDLIIKATENAKEPDALLYRIMAFASLEKFDEALDVIEQNKELLESKAMSLLIMIHVDILLFKGDTLGALKLANYYAEKPYVSQEVEEIIQSIPQRIDDFLKQLRGPDSKMIPERQIIKLLTSQKADEIVSAIDYLKDKDVSAFLKYIEEIMIDFPKQSIRSLALLTLVEQQVNHEVMFKSHKGLIKVNPSKLTQPFGETFMKIVDELGKEKDSSLASVIENTIACIVIHIYPSQIDGDDLLFLTAARAVAAKQLLQDLDLDAVCKQTGLDYFELENKITEIEEIVADF